MPDNPDINADSAFLAKKQGQNDQAIAQAYLAQNPDRAQAYGLETASTGPQAPAGPSQAPQPDQDQAAMLKERQQAQHATAERAGEHVQNLETAIHVLDPIAKGLTAAGAIGTGGAGLMEMGVPAAQAMLGGAALAKLQQLGGEGAKALGQKIWGPDHPMGDFLAELAGSAVTGGAAVGAIPNTEAVAGAVGDLGEAPAQPEGEAAQPAEGAEPAPPSAHQVLAQKQIEALQEARVGKTTAEEFGRPDIATQVSEEQTMKEAQALRARVEPFQPSEQFPRRPPMAAQTAALAQVYQDEAKGLRDSAVDLLNRGAAGEDISGDKAALEQRFAAYAVNYANLAGTRSEAGRALQILDPLKPGNLFAADTAKLAQELAADPDANLVEKLAAIDPERASTMARQMGEATAQGRSVSGMMREYYINALLSKPSTFIAKKLSGDLSSYALAAPTRWVASKIPSWGEAAPVAPGEASAFATRSIAATQDALRIAGLAFQNGTSAVDALGGGGGTEFEPGITLPQIRGDGSDDLVSHGLDYLGTLIRMPSRTIQAETDFAHVINYRGQLGALSLRQATQEATTRGLDGERAAQFIEQRAAALENDPTPEMVEASHAFAREQTFLKPLGPIGQSFVDTLNKLPAGLGRVLFPFRQVPLNLYKFMQGYSPLALATRDFWGGIQQGGAEGQLAVAKLGIGTMITGLGAKLYMDGHITGAGPHDMKDYRNQLATGWKPYSIKVGDTYVSYDRMDPIGLMLGLPADYMDIMSQMPSADDTDSPWANKIQHASTALAITLGRTYSHQSYVQTAVNLTNFIDSLREGNDYAGALSKFGAQELSGLIPAAIRGEARREDPVVRDTRGFMDTLLAGVPGFSKDMPPKRDLEGNPILTPPGFFANEVYPFQIGAENKNPIAKEISTVGASPQKPPDIVPGSGRQPRAFDAQNNPDVGVPLDKWQKDRWQVLRATIKDPDEGTMSDALKSVMADPDYKSLANEDKAKQLEKVILSYGKAATAQLLDEDRDLQSKYALRQQYKVLGHAPAGSNPADILKQAGLQ